MVSVAIDVSLDSPDVPAYKASVGTKTCNAPATGDAPLTCIIGALPGVELHSALQQVPAVLARRVKAMHFQIVRFSHFGKTTIDDIFCYARPLLLTKRSWVYMSDY